MGWVYQYALVDRTGKHDLSQLTSLQNWFLKYELQTVEGVSEVATVGGMVRQYQVRVDPDKLRAYGIPLSLIETAIKQGNQETGASVIEMAEAEYMVRSNGYLKSVEDLKQIRSVPLCAAPRCCWVTWRMWSPGPRAGAVWPSSTAREKWWAASSSCAMARMPSTPSTGSRRGWRS